MENTDNAIFNLMQNIVDKLETIEKRIETKNEQKEIEIKSFISTFKNQQSDILKCIQALYDVTMGESESNEMSRQEISDKLKETELIPVVNETNNEYSLIGSKSIFTPKQLIAFMVFLVVIWSSIKYIPPYLNEKSDIKQKFEEYDILTNYIYLNNDTKTKDFMNRTLDKIRKKDTVFMKHYYKIMKKHQIELQKRKLQQELKSLEQ